MLVQNEEIRDPGVKEALDGALDDLNLGEPGMRPAMLAAVTETFGYTGYFLTTRQAGRLTGLASVLEVPKLPWGRYLTSVPTGFWAADEPSEAALLDALRDICRRRKLNGPFLKDMIQPLKTAPSRQVAEAAVKQVGGDEAQLLQSYSASVRRNLKKARTAGLYIETSQTSDDFYCVWSSRMRDLGTPALPKTLMRKLLGHFGPQSTVLLARKDDMVIGGALILAASHQAMDPYIASATRFFELRPNFLLYHEMMMWAQNRGLSHFNLGRSQPGSGNQEFKRRFRPEFMPLFDYHPVAGSAINRGEASKAGQALSFFWKRLPTGTANRLGPLLRRYIPYG